ncbi:hypothetical protein AA0242T_2592 [Acetobacter aceti NRIC 0242]|uniref:DUF485 domain-containing protein n=1 Tax=Acetobacter aceti NBRC 14818 TaxID=887700 RepID=A0AB33ICT4_ACEAC|nr:DUF485 domain-containing protein [Acetobacter aceti]TCS25625.1 uncharacterized protein DUF485 [Acetobacter aceti NBRC 14818]BCK75832.1 hypothetical protein EMQ_1438 [Acetobacter aceti NBRC 14818]GAN58015.1 hypothetical protein Abac_026_002 [Acetobacter aceti NBRC 14818]GBO81890.1 hypothetical protein AA0242T_2592 [Acetobacter aceti NRIC 0242]
MKETINRLDTTGMVERMRIVDALFTVTFLALYSFYVGAYSFFPRVLATSFAEGSVFNGALLMAAIIPVTGIILTGIYVFLADRIDRE